MATTIETRVAAVTVYPEGARVVRRGALALPSAGEHLLSVAGLPLGIEQSSLRATGQGPTGTRLLGVESQVEYHPAAPEETLARLRDELRRLTREHALVDQQAKALDEQRKWLRSLGEQSARSLAWGIARHTATPEDASALFAFSAEEARRIATAGQDLAAQREDLQRQIEAVQREQAQLGGRRPADRVTALVRLVLPSPGTVELELSYLVAEANWRPRYDARVRAEVGRVRLTQTAVVEQRTGEDWRGVTLALSTARPSAAIRLPDVPDPWYLSVPAPPRPHPGMMLRAAMPYAANEMEAMAPEASVAASTATDYALLADFAPPPVEVEHAGAAQVFSLPGGVDVPTDGEPHLLTLGEHELPARLDYVAQPVVAPGAHLRAMAENRTGGVLLPGEVHVFHAGDASDEYVGTTHLDLTAEGAPLPLYLGVDDNITVKRELAERDTDKGSLLQSNLRRVTLGYRVTLANHTGLPQTVLLKDRLPIPRHEKIKVKVLDLRPQPTEHTRLEQLTWELRLAPGEERRIEWRVLVEAPGDLHVLGLP